MRLLRLVGPGDDNCLTLETADGEEQFALPVDQRLKDAASSDLPRIPTMAHAPSAPSPRDIQTRVRGGEDPQSIADRAGISLERVMRFAFPVLQERIRAADEARRGRTRGPDGHLVPFGELVEDRLQSAGVNLDDVDWDAFRRPDGGWTVTAAFPAVDDETATAKFSFALASRTVSPLNEVGSDVLSQGPIKALVKQPPPPEFGPIEDEPADGEPAEDAAGGRPARDARRPPRLAAVPDRAESDQPDPSGGSAQAEPLGLPESGPFPEAGEFPGSAEDSPEPGGPLTSRLRLHARRQRAHTAPLPVGIDDELFDQDGPGPWPDLLPFEPAEAGPERPDGADGANSDDAGPGSARGSHGCETAVDGEDTPPKRGRRPDKPRMPSWDDILFGVRHKTD